MKNKTNYLFALTLIITMLLSSCSNSNNSTQTTNNISTTNQVENQNSNSSSETQEINLEEKNLELKTSSNPIEKISFNWDSISYSWDNAFVSWTKLTITKAGNYEITWTLNDWQIIVETEDKEAVKIILNGVEITNQNTSPIYVENAKQTIIYLSKWTINTLTDWNDYSFNWEEDEPNSTIFSKDELVIMWEWKLFVNANYNDAIASKDELYIESWNIEINAKDDWIRWKDYLQIDGWDINIVSSWDALKADNEEKWQIYINGWDIEISTWDDAIHAEASLTVNDWNINITKSYEWLESKVITINWWNINVVSSDDWLNVAWWNDWSGMWWPWGSMDFWLMKSSVDTDYVIYINGWVINVNANWDWLDANGTIIMTWWEVYVNWPTSSWNWPLDYDKWFKISSWILVAAWSSWMAQNIWSDSTQYGMLIWFDSTISAKTEFILKDSSWKQIISFTPIKNYQSIVISTPELKNGETYNYFLNWEEKWSFTISSITTSVWNIWRWWWGMWWWFDWWIPPDGWNRINPLEVTSFDQLDDKFLQMLEQQTLLSSDEIKSMMESASWKTLKEILEENNITFSFWPWGR